MSWLPIRFIRFVIKSWYVCRVMTRGYNGRTGAYTAIFALYFAWEDLKIARVSTVADRDDWYADQAASRTLFATFTLDACVAIMVNTCKGAARKHKIESLQVELVCACAVYSGGFRTQVSTPYQPTHAQIRTQINHESVGYPSCWSRFLAFLTCTVYTAARICVIK